MNNGDPADAQPSRSAEQLRMLAQALDAVPSAIAFWDSEIRNVFANRAYIEWLGVPPEEVRGRHAKDLLDGGSYELSLPYMLAALDGESQIFERSTHGPDGDRETQVEYTPYAVGDEIIGFVAIIIDVSVRVEAERAARVTAERLATLTERQRIEQRAHEGILQDLFAVQLNIERARAAVATDDAPVVSALETALDRLDAAVADLRLVLGMQSAQPADGHGGSPSRLSAAVPG